MANKKDFTPISFNKFWKYKYKGLLIHGYNNFHLYFIYHWPMGYYKRKDNIFRKFEIKFPKLETYLTNKMTRLHLEKKINVKLLMNKDFVMDLYKAYKAFKSMGIPDNELTIFYNKHESI